MKSFASFSELFCSLDFDNIRRQIYETKVSEALFLSVVNRARKLEALSLHDFMVLISPLSLRFLDKLQKAAFDVTLQRHGKVMQLYAPLYLSNECSNACIYCGFNAHNRVERITLTEAQIDRETDVIKGMGIDHLLLVSGEIRNKTGVDYVSKCASGISQKFSYISVEVSPMDVHEYRQLFDSGIEGIICYQETYDREKYEMYHPSGPKKDMNYRLNTLDRAGLANMRWLGIGALLGLSDHRFESVLMAMHAVFLQKKYWKSSITVSFPRIRPAKGGFTPLFPVNDDELLQMISALRLFLPDASLILSTREFAIFRDKAIFYGINQLSAGSKTNPLGYSSTVATGEQFDIADHRMPQELIKKLSEQGYDPVFKNWDRGFR